VKQKAQAIRTVTIRLFQTTTNAQIKKSGNKSRSFFIRCVAYHVFFDTENTVNIWLFLAPIILLCVGCVPLEQWSKKFPFLNAVEGITLALVFGWIVIATIVYLAQQIMTIQELANNFSGVFIC